MNVLDSEQIQFLDSAEQITRSLKTINRVSLSVISDLRAGRPVGFAALALIIPSPAELTENGWDREEINALNQDAREFRASLNS